MEDLKVGDIIYQETWFDKYLSLYTIIRLTPKRAYYKVNDKCEDYVPIDMKEHYSPSSSDRGHIPSIFYRETDTIKNRYEVQRLNKKFNEEIKKAYGLSIEKKKRILDIIKEE